MATESPPTPESKMPMGFPDRHLSLKDPSSEDTDDLTGCHACPPSACGKIIIIYPILPKYLATQVFFRSPLWVQDRFWR